MEQKNMTVEEFYKTYNVIVSKSEIKTPKYTSKNLNVDCSDTDSNTRLECALLLQNQIVTSPACGQRTNEYVFLLISQTDVKTMISDFGYRISPNNSTNIDISELENTNKTD